MQHPLKGPVQQRFAEGLNRSKGPGRDAENRIVDLGVKGKNLCL